MTEDKALSLARIRRLRTTVCGGCHWDYYNWPKVQSPRGDVAVPEGSYCYSMPSIDLRRKPPCKAYHR